MQTEGEIEYKVGTIITYECDEGFTTPDETTTKCVAEEGQEEGRWSNEGPTCSRVTCGPPKLIQNGNIQAESFLYGAVAVYACLDGYMLMGDSELRCGREGVWVGSTPTCPPISCGPPPTPAHTYPRYEIADHGLRFSYGSGVSYSCTHGYEMEGNAHLFCGGNGTWEGEEPRCREARCPELPSLAHGRATEQEGESGRVNFVCDYGYDLHGDNGTVCRFGRWREVSTTCIPVNCYEPAIPLYASITAEAFTYSTVATYSCNFGYMLVGNAEVMCDADGLWKGDIPTCLPVNCGQPDMVSNGEVQVRETLLGSSVTYSCYAGYQLFGDAVRECTAKAVWSGDQPQCHPKDCGEIEAPKNGFAIGSDTTFEQEIGFGCDRGFVLNGDPISRCLENGTWSQSTPACTPIRCPEPSRPPNTQDLEPRTWQYADEASYVCEAGYLMRGQLSTTCLHTGQWSDVQGQCSKISCGRPRFNMDGVTLLGRSFYYGDSVVYRCPPGKRSNGTSTLRCLDTGEWSGSGVCVGRCGSKCLNGGVCLNNNVCSCPPGYVGHHCQHAVCVARCLNGGTCVAPYKCRCLPGYTGHRCQKPVCEGGCGIGGKCIGPNVCHCYDGSVSPHCQGSDYNYEDYYTEEQDTTYQESPHYTE